MKKVILLVAALGLAATTTGCPDQIAAGKAEMGTRRDKEAKPAGAAE